MEMRSVWTIVAALVVGAPVVSAQVNEVKTLAPDVYFHQGDIDKGRCNNGWVVCSRTTCWSSMRTSCPARASSCRRSAPSAPNPTARARWRPSGCTSRATTTSGERAVPVTRTEAKSGRGTDHRLGCTVPAGPTTASPSWSPRAVIGASRARLPRMLQGALQKRDLARMVEVVLGDPDELRVGRVRRLGDQRKVQALRRKVSHRPSHVLIQLA